MAGKMILLFSREAAPKKDEEWGVPTNKLSLGLEPFVAVEDFSEVAILEYLEERLRVVRVRK